MNNALWNNKVSSDDVPWSTFKTSLCLKPMRVNNGGNRNTVFLKQLNTRQLMKTVQVCRLGNSVLRYSDTRLEGSQVGTPGSCQTHRYLSTKYLPASSNLWPTTLVMLNLSRWSARSSSMSLRQRGHLGPDSLEQWRTRSSKHFRCRKWRHVSRTRSDAEPNPSPWQTEQQTLRNITLFRLRCRGLVAPSSPTRRNSPRDCLCPIWPARPGATPLCRSSAMKVKMIANAIFRGTSNKHLWTVTTLLGGGKYVTRRY